MDNIIKIIKETPNDTTLGTKIRNLYLNNELNDDKYLRLAAEYDNYRKRSNKESAQIKDKIKSELFASLMGSNSDLTIALSQIKSQDDKKAISIMISNINKVLSDNGIQEIQTDNYDPELHEVISKTSDEDNIIGVVSKGYTLNGNIIRYPKVILG